MRSRGKQHGVMTWAIDVLQFLLDIRHWRGFMYEKCIGCERLGKDCYPNLYVMNIEEIREWALALKKHRGLTNAELSDMSGVPKGTIDHAFSNRAREVNYSTFAPLLCTLIGAEKKEMPCSRQLENEEVSAVRIAEYEARIARTDALLAWRKRVIVFLIVICCILIGFILVGIVVDFMDANIGYFWR